jgi:phosphoglycerate dehydrogenase-like enzyme
MDVCAWSRSLTVEGAAEHGVRRLELDEVLTAADVVTVQLSLSESTRGLLDEARLRRIGPRGVLVNTARGAIVDEKALVKVLGDGGLGGAGLDVYDEEPLAEGSPLRRLDNVVLASHLGWIADQTYRLMAEAAVRIVEAYLDGTYTRGLNPEALENRRRQPRA